jgi:hypothetical protein
VQMQTRRQLLQQTVALPFAMCLRATPAQSTVEIISEPNCLSQESAEGFRALLASITASDITIVCGISRLNSHRVFELRERALRGAWIIWENPPFAPYERILEGAFGIATRDRKLISSDRLYISYTWPVPALTRTFSAITPVSCAPAEVVARYGNVPVVMKRHLGRGGIVFLGSMLGPNLRAEEREAKQIATAIFSGITSAGTSTEA